jgi:quinol monooxygenase YgiN
MRNPFAVLLLVTSLVLPAALAAAGDPQIAHTVYFALKDDTPENREALAAACVEYLSGQPGAVSFAVGTLADEYDRPINDRGFDVALYLVFEDAAALEAYNTNPRHQQFIRENFPLLEGARVFDFHLVAPATSSQPAEE